MPVFAAMATFECHSLSEIHPSSDFLHSCRCSDSVEEHWSRADQFPRECTPTAHKHGH